MSARARTDESVSDAVQGKVARILSTRELVINRGVKDGVRIGMVFDVLDPSSEDIQDPDSGEVLGSVYRPKVQVRVSEVDERLAVARTFHGKRVNVGGIGVSGLGALHSVLQPPKYVDKYETLRSDDAAWQPLPESKSFVKVGDPVVQVLTDEDDDERARTLGDAAAGGAKSSDASSTTSS